MSRPSRKQRRKMRQEGIIDSEGNFNPKNFHISGDITMLTSAQKDAADAWDEGYNLFLHGIAGTGKTFLALYFAFKEVMDKNSDARKVYIIRSAVPGRDQGFQPGTLKQKQAVYESPYPPICEQIFGRKDSYDLLKQRNLVEFKSTSYLRGETFDDAIVVVDEIQNLSDQEAHTIMTRVGARTKIIFAGDIKQDDLTSERFREKTGLRDFMKIISNMDEFDLVEFFAEDIVRSDLVKSYIIARDKMGL